MGKTKEDFIDYLNKAYEREKREMKRKLGVLGDLPKFTVKKSCTSCDRGQVSWTDFASPGYEEVYEKYEAGNTKEKTVCPLCDSIYVVTIEKREMNKAKYKQKIKDSFPGFRFDEVDLMKLRETRMLYMTHESVDFSLTFAFDNHMPSRVQYRLALGTSESPRDYYTGGIVIEDSFDERAKDGLLRMFLKRVELLEDEAQQVRSRKLLRQIFGETK